LLIDDETSFVQALARLLQRDGYTVHTADNGQHALAQLRTQCYDVILCDLHMPALDGHTLYALMRQQSPDLCQRMIFVTCVLDTFFCLGWFGPYRRLWPHNAIHFSEVH